MNTLQHSVISLFQAEEQQVKILQEINTAILTNCRLRITPTLYVYPLEVEAYYNNGHNFKDYSCHCHRLQQNRFGKLYFHRLGQTDTYNKNRGGVDLCLSSHENIYYSVLIRSARLETTGIIGPHNLAETICQQANLSIEELEQNEILENDTLNSSIQETIFHGPRINLGKDTDSKYRELNLRSLTQLKTYPFKEKENHYNSAT